MPTFAQTWTYNFVETVTEPPTGSQLRLNGLAPYDTVSKMWIRSLTNDGRDVSTMLRAIVPGSDVLVQDRNEASRYVVFRVTAAPIAKTDYVELPVVRRQASSAPLIGGQAIDLYAAVQIGTTTPPAGGGAGAWWYGWEAPRFSPAVSVLIGPPTEELFTIEAALLRAGLAWPANDPREPMMLEWIRAARAKVEQDTGLALVNQTRTVFFDAPIGSVLTLPALSMPLVSVTTITALASDGSETEIPASSYIIDYARGRVFFTGGWPAAVRIAVTLIAGWPSAAALALEAPLLMQAAGLLLAHYATVGRDLAIVGTIVNETPEGYDDLLASYRPVTVI